MNILLQTSGKQMRNGEKNPKVPSGEWWGSLLDWLTQNGHTTRILPEVLGWDGMLQELEWCDTWIAPDSYWQHFAWYEGKPGIVVFSQSDPLLFGHDCNTNIYKDKGYFRKDQYATWEQAQYNEDAFPSVGLVCEAITKWKTAV